MKVLNPIKPVAGLLSNLWSSSWLFTTLIKRVLAKAKYTIALLLTYFLDKTRIIWANALVPQVVVLTPSTQKVDLDASLLVSFTLSVLASLRQRF